MRGGAGGLREKGEHGAGNRLHAKSSCLVVHFMQFSRSCKTRYKQVRWRKGWEKEGRLQQTGYSMET
eukprot:155079-Hanusia_phi.AAC.1